MAEPANRVRVVHYLNQFFGGVGGEEQANRPVEVRAGPAGPGRALQQLLGARAEVVATLVGGDNYVSEHRDEALATVRAGLEELRADVVAAGPAFDAGRYGVACAEVCHAAAELGIPAVAAMHPENPGVLIHRDTLVVPTGASPSDMPSVLAKLARLAMKLAGGEEPGPAAEEGYLPRGIRRPGLREKAGRERALDMLTAKLRGLPYATEMVVRPYAAVLPAPPLEDPASATLGLITTGGIVPKGNPDRLVRGGAEHWFRYSIVGLDRLDRRDWDCVHRGFHIEIVKENPDYVLPLGVVREIERAGAIGGLYPWFFSTSGVGTAVTDAARMGGEMAEELRAAGVAGAILVAT
jgi:glycine reductase